jgi:hypothetical protein
MWKCDFSGFRRISVGIGSHRRGGRYIQKGWGERDRFRGWDADGILINSTKVVNNGIIYVRDHNLRHVGKSPFRSRPYILIPEFVPRIMCPGAQDKLETW